MTDRPKTPPNADEEAWLQSGVEALKNAEEHGYACTAEEMNAIIEAIITDYHKTANNTAAQAKDDVYPSEHCLRTIFYLYGIDQKRHGGNG